MKIIATFSRFIPEMKRKNIILSWSSQLIVIFFFLVDILIRKGDEPWNCRFLNVLVF